MTNTIALPTLVIQSEFRDEDRKVTDYGGSFTQHPDWTFEASVGDDIAWDSDVCNISCGRINDYVLMHNGDLYLADPACYYDGEAPDLAPLPESLIQALDAYFGPPQEERERRLEERQDTARRLQEVLSFFLEESFGHEDPSLVTLALRRLEMTYRERSGDA